MSRQSTPDDPESQPGSESNAPQMPLQLRMPLHLTWSVQYSGREVRKAQLNQPDPGSGRPNRLFVPDSVRARVLQWGHSSKLTCHPGSHRTLVFLKQRFWWPPMNRDTRSFVAACSTCARSKSNHQAPAGLLNPLPIPSRPWSYVAVDFVSGLPVSEDNTTIPL